MHIFVKVRRGNKIYWLIPYWELLCCASVKSPLKYLYINSNLWKPIFGWLVCLLNPLVLLSLHKYLRAWDPDQPKSPSSRLSKSGMSVPCWDPKRQKSHINEWWSSPHLTLTQLGATSSSDKGRISAWFFPQGRYDLKPIMNFSLHLPMLLFPKSVVILPSFLSWQSENPSWESDYHRCFLQPLREWSSDMGWSRYTPACLKCYWHLPCSFFTRAVPQ